MQEVEDLKRYID
jgi:chromosome segregation ATPase